MGQRHSHSRQVAGQPPGVTVIFRVLWLEHRMPNQTIGVMGDCHALGYWNRVLALEKKPCGEWAASVEMPPGTFQYKYISMV